MRQDINEVERFNFYRIRYNILVTDTLLQTKLKIPPLQPNLVQRPRLFKKLNKSLHARLTLVSAPAGFGKTTLVSEWAAAREQPVAWLSLDEDDSDPVRFLLYFAASLQQIEPDLDQEIVGILQTSPSMPMKTAVTALINEIGALTEPIILVLDDYHLIQAEAIHNTLVFLLEHQPAQLHLVITTREDPPIPLSRWRARGQLTEIREHDLRFTASEAAELLNGMMDLKLTPEQLEMLGSKTEGWISGLHLAALSLQGQADVDGFVHAFAGSNRFILDYLIEEVFQQQPPDVREFLLQTAVLEELTAPLCDAVMVDGEKSGSSSQTMLERLEQANLFIVALDDARHWFRYHHLFADLLRQRLRLEKGDTTVYHLRAAAWHEEYGIHSRAIKQYIAAAAWEKAAALIELQSGELQKRGENTTFLHWMQALPQAVIQNHPGLCLAYAWALALSGQPHEAEGFLQVAEVAFRDNPSQYSNVLSAQIHVARIRQDLPQTITLSRRALSLIPAAAADARSALALNLGIAHWQSGQIAEAESALSEAQDMARQAQNHHVRLLAMGFLGLVQAAQGELHQAAKQTHAALDWGADYPASAMPHLVQGALLYEWNQLEEAGSYLQKAIKLAQRSGNNELESSAQRQWALLMQATGNHTAALAALAVAERVAGDNAPQLTRARSHATAVYIALAQNDLETAKQRFAQMQTAASASIFYVQLGLIPARLYLAQGDKSSAAVHLAAAYDKAERSGLRYGQIEIRLLQALAASGADDALAFLTDALTSAQGQGFRRIFIDKGVDIIPLLHMAGSKQDHPDYCRSLLAEFESTPSSPPTSSASEPAAAALVETISAREIEVLQFLADGLTYQEIAQTMFVSVNTVKSHLKSIYGKLSVHNRREAVARARLYHLIDPKE